MGKQRRPETSDDVSKSTSEDTTSRTVGTTTGDGEGKNETSKSKVVEVELRAGCCRAGQPPWRTFNSHCQLVAMTRVFTNVDVSRDSCSSDARSRRVVRGEGGRRDGGTSGWQQMLYEENNQSVTSPSSMQLAR